MSNYCKHGSRQSRFGHTGGEEKQTVNTLCNVCTRDVLHCDCSSVKEGSRLKDMGTAFEAIDCPRKEITNTIHTTPDGPKGT